MRPLPSEVTTMKIRTAIAVAGSLAIIAGSVAPAFAAGKKSGFVSYAGRSSNPAPNTNNNGTTTGPKGALKNGQITPNTNLPGNSEKSRMP